MAEGKNTIIVYRDWKNIFDKLTDEEAGKLIKHLFAYVNDENPKSDRLIELVFEPMRITLKRDLHHWSNVIEKRREAGRQGGRPRKAKKANGFLEKQNKAKKADSVIDSVIVTDSDKKKEYIYSEFYDLEIEKSNNDPSYIIIVKTLFGENKLKSPLKGVLKIEKQLSFSEFSEVIKKSAEKNRSIIDMLENMENGKYYKDKKSIYKTLLNWLNRN